MAQEPSVVAVIPNYNMADSLAELLPQIIKQKYDAIYVLDDASTDDSKKIVASFGPKVHFVAGHKNLGAGGNRNRILGKLKPDTIIHFLDADMRLETPNIPDVARGLMADPGIGFVGGLVLTTTGLQMRYNYGPRQCMRHSLGVMLHETVLKLGSVLPTFEQWLRRNIPELRSWPNPRVRPQSRRVFWVSEANMLIRAGTFDRLRGFDPELRDNEILEFGIRVYAEGLKNYFSPEFTATHAEILVRTGNRSLARVRYAVRIIQKQGIKDWLTWSRKLEPAEQFHKPT